MSTKASILVVEDEQKIRSALTDFLEFQGFSVTVAEDGAEADKVIREKNFDLVLLDLMLPKISGEDLCVKWRREGRQVPVIMLTAKGQEKERIAGLNMGADDYLTKPFSLEELLARIDAVLRRTDPARTVGQCFRLADLDVDVPALTVTRKDQVQSITRREADILLFFAANPRRVISRQELYQAVWHDAMTGVVTRTTDMHIAKLRSKIEIDPGQPRIITTVHGAGYRYEP